MKRRMYTWCIVVTCLIYGSLQVSKGTKTGLSDGIEWVTNERREKEALTGHPQLLRTDTDDYWQIADSNIAKIANNDDDSEDNKAEQQSAFEGVDETPSVKVDDDQGEENQPDRDEEKDKDSMDIHFVNANSDHATLDHENNVGHMNQKSHGNEHHNCKHKGYTDLKESEERTVETPGRKVNTVSQEEEEEEEEKRRSMLHYNPHKKKKLKRSNFEEGKTEPKIKRDSFGHNGQEVFGHQDEEHGNVDDLSILSHHIDHSDGDIQRGTGDDELALHLDDEAVQTQVAEIEEEDTNVKNMLQGAENYANHQTPGNLEGDIEKELMSNNIDYHKLHSEGSDDGVEKESQSPASRREMEEGRRHSYHDNDAAPSWREHFGQIQREEQGQRKHLIAKVNNVKNVKNINNTEKIKQAAIYSLKKKKITNSKTNINSKITKTYANAKDTKITDKNPSRFTSNQTIIGIKNNAAKLAVKTNSHSKLKHPKNNDIQSERSKFYKALYSSTKQLVGLTKSKRKGNTTYNDRELKMLQQMYNSPSFLTSVKNTQLRNMIEKYGDLTASEKSVLQRLIGGDDIYHDEVLPGVETGYKRQILGQEGITGEWITNAKKDKEELEGHSNGYTNVRRAIESKNETSPSSDDDLSILSHRNDNTDGNIQRGTVDDELALHLDDEAVQTQVSEIEEEDKNVKKILQGAENFASQPGILGSDVEKELITNIEDENVKEHTYADNHAAPQWPQHHEQNQRNERGHRKQVIAKTNNVKNVKHIKNIAKTKQTTVSSSKKKKTTNGKSVLEKSGNADLKGETTRKASPKRKINLNITKLYGNAKDTKIADKTHSRVTNNQTIISIKQNTANLVMKTNGTGNFKHSKNSDIQSEQNKFYQALYSGTKQLLGLSKSKPKANTTYNDTELKMLQQMYHSRPLLKSMKNTPKDVDASRRYLSPNFEYQNREPRLRNLIQKYGNLDAKEKSVLRSLIERDDTNDDDEDLPGVEIGQKRQALGQEGLTGGSTN